jgi:uncharacterized protein YbjT (DUF2867 family)
MKTAVVIGATGLVGKCLIEQLLKDPAYARVVALTRRATALRADNYEEHVVDFGAPDSYAAWLKGDVLFSALGTTRSQAGSIAAQRRVDYTFQLEVARAAAQNGIPAYVLVSSSGADPRSFSSYLKMKGELDRDVQGLGFSALHVLRPGPLSGERERPRPGEVVAETVLGAFNALGLLRSMRPIRGEQVARAMRRAATLSGARTHGPLELFKLAE